MSVNAYEEIRNLLGSYTEHMDAGRFADLAELFRDATMVSASGDVIADGYDAVRQNYERGTQLYDGSPRTKHITANIQIEVDEDAGTATARSAYVVFQGTDALPLQPIITGRYRDSFVRDGSGHWRFSQRMFFVDQIGDLSRHLTYEVTE
jgi:3-phenylpropionate/cinnamic acid dioxygenase small subunit